MKGRRRSARAHLWASSLLMLAVVLMANYLAFRHYERWDWTSQQLYTLSERSRQILSELSQPVDIYLFMSESERNFQDVQELLQRYQAESGRLSVHYVDPDRRPSEYQTLLQRFGVRAAKLESGDMVAEVAAVVSSGERHWRITRDDLMAVDYDSMNRGSSKGPKVDVTAERALSGGILQVTQGRPTRVCVTQGHGEWSLQAKGKRSLDALQQELRRDNVELEAIDTLGSSRVPEHCDSVFVVGPVRAFTSEEAKLLGRYVRGGGGLLLALDPVIEHDQVKPTGLEDMVRQFGVRLDRTVVLERDRARRLRPSPVEPFMILKYGDHPTTRPVRAMGGRTVVRLARSVRAADGGKGETTALFETSKQAFAETDYAEVNVEQGTPSPDDDDIQGPVSLAVAVERATDAGDSQSGKERGEQGQGSGHAGRMIVVGDSDWLKSKYMQSPGFTNVDLASSFTGWLSERKALISIAPRKVDASGVAMTEGDLAGLLFRVLVLMPAAVLLMGFAVWWSRRS
jgi:ABC-type uncharacterized transport system involved in gliding motility auxiliary subunit